MWVVVGLGNPGEQYAGTRHNVGYLVADRLASLDPCVRRSSLGLSRVAEARVSELQLAIVWPETYMNRSGLALMELGQRTPFDLSCLVVLHDDVDLPFGTIRLKLGGGLGGHRGLGSIASELGSTEFLRVRLGIGRPLAGDLSEHVLGPWDPAEYEVLGDLLDRACEATMQLLADGIALASNRWNVRPRGTPRAPSNDREMDPSDEQGDERPAKGTISEPRGDADKGQMDGDSGRDP